MNQTKQFTYEELFGNRIEHTTLLKPTSFAVDLCLNSITELAEAAFAPAIVPRHEVAQHLLDSDVIFYGRKNDKMRHFWRA